MVFQSLAPFLASDDAVAAVVAYGFQSGAQALGVKGEGTGLQARVPAFFAETLSVLKTHLQPAGIGKFCRNDQKGLGADITAPQAVAKISHFFNDLICSKNFNITLSPF